MNSLIGDRFLKRFFRNRSYRHQPNPVVEAPNVPEAEVNEPEVKMPDEQVYPSSEDQRKKDTSLESEKPGEINQLIFPENGSTGEV